MYEFQNVPEKTKPPKIPISSKKVINSLNLYCKQLSQSITKEPMLSCDYAMHHPETKYIECYKVCFFKERKYLKKGSDDPKICKNCPPAQLGIDGAVFANFGSNDFVKYVLLKQKFICRLLHLKSKARSRCPYFIHNFMQDNRNQPKNEPPILTSKIVSERPFLLES